MPYVLTIALMITVAALQRRRLIAFADWCLERADQSLDAVRTRRGGDWPVALVLLLPALAVLGVFGAAPFAYALYLSVRTLELGEWHYVGLDHYREAIGSQEVWRALLVTTYYAASTIPIGLLLSLSIAWQLYRMQFGRTFFRTAYFLPYVTSAVAAATVWRVLLRPQLGGVNGFLESVGLEPQRWLLEPRGVLSLLTDGWAPHWFGPSLGLACIVAFEIWHSAGFMIVVLLAAFTAIPRELEEAALIDGASRLQVFRHVVAPLLSPVIFFLLIVGVIWAFQAFNSFYALTVGMRRPDTQNLIMLIYAQIYENQRYGYGSAIAVLLSLGIMLLSLAQWRLAGRRVHYE
ncbi:MAG: ABC transporter permease [Candidatus Hydrogenedentota bacterium]